MSLALERDPHFARAARVNADRAQAKQAPSSKAALGKKLPAPIVYSARCGWTSEKLSAANAKERVMARQGEERRASWRFDAAQPLGHHDCVTLNGATLGRGDNVVLGGLDLSVGSRARIAILGANGVGKSSLFVYVCLLRLNFLFPLRAHSVTLVMLRCPCLLGANGVVKVNQPC